MLWTIGLVSGQNLYGRQAVAQAALAALAKSKGTLLVFGANVVAG